MFTAIRFWLTANRSLTLCLVVIVAHTATGHAQSIPTYMGQWGGFYYPWGIATHPGTGAVYVCDTWHNKVQIFSPSGTYQTSYGAYLLPLGIAVLPSGEYYVSNDYNLEHVYECTVSKYNSAGARLTFWGGPGTGEGKFNSPFAVALDADGYVYVTDCFNDRVQKFTADGAFVRSWGSHGEGPGEFQEPRGIAVDHAGFVIVADGVNSRLQKFDRDGAFVMQWGTPGHGSGELSSPNGVAVDGHDNVYVVDAGNDRVQVFSPEGRYLLGWGGKGSGNGQFNQPVGIAVGGDNDVYVTDTGNGRVQWFRMPPVPVVPETWGRIKASYR